MVIHDKFYCEGYGTYNNFRNILEKLSKRQRVEFALYCAKDVFHLVNDQDKENAKLCIDLIEKWLIDENSVTSEELRNAANAGASASYTAHAANAAADSSWAAATNAHAAVYATWAATNAYDAYAESNKLNEYLIIANSYLTKTNINCPNYEIEGKILYLIDELEENIIVHKDKYYANMNEIERCPEYGFNTQQELLEELLYSKDQFWVFTRNWLDQLYKKESNVNS